MCSKPDFVGVFVVKAETIRVAITSVDGSETNEIVFFLLARKNAADDVDDVAPNVGAGRRPEEFEGGAIDKPDTTRDADFGGVLVELTVWLSAIRTASALGNDFLERTLWLRAIRTARALGNDVLQIELGGDLSNRAGEKGGNEPLSAHYNLLLSTDSNF